MATQPVTLPSDYWSQSRRPLASLLFAAPLLVIYESGLLCFGPGAPRNGAEAWLRQWLNLLGFNAYFLLPGLTIGILLGWHYVLRQPWRVRRTVLYGMAGECLGLAAVLWLSWMLCQVLVRMGVRAVGLSILGMLANLSCYLGAGLYEELLFRLVVLNLLIGLLVWMRVPRRASVFWGIVLSSLLFSAAHYVGPAGDAFGWMTFLFRFLAGAFFAALFLYRGFGIAAGTHAFYDVLVGLALLLAGRGHA